MSSQGHVALRDSTNRLASGRISGTDEDVWPSIYITIAGAGNVAVEALRVIV